MGCFGYICKGCGTSIRGDYHRGGEKCVMIHVRHGVEMGRVEGHYDEYGRVVEEVGLPEEMKFRGDSDIDSHYINSHYEICESEMRMKDSYNSLRDKRYYKEKVVDFPRYLSIRGENELKRCNYNIRNTDFYFAISKQSEKYAEASKLLREIEAVYSDLLKVSDERDKMYLEYKIISKIQVLLDFLCWTLYNKNFMFYDEFINLPEINLEKYSGIVAYHSVCYRRAKRDGSFNLIPSESDPNQSWGKLRKKFC